MKYALLAFGIVLMIGGAFSIYSGSGIIEMERGWAGVLAGATAVTGGAITIGLAWILRTLEQIRASLETGASRRSTELNRLVNEPLIEIPDVTAPVIPAAEAPEEPAPAAPSAAPATAEAAEPAAAEAAELPAQADVPPPPPLAAELPENPPAPVPPSDKIRRLPRVTTVFAEAATKGQTAASPSADELWQRVATDMTSMRLGQSPYSPRARIEPAEGDWLDRALAGLESADMPQDASEGEQAPPFVPEAEQPSEPQLKIVGRYTAAGTVYVMFSDGSIEAQSAQGVYRFGSMAELKAYFQA